MAAAMLAVLIPADQTKPIQAVEVDPDRLAGSIGAEWFELVHHQWLRDRDLVMVVDEEGLLNGSIPNPRAGHFYPYGAGIRGDALICAEVDGPDGLDLASLSPMQVGALAGLPWSHHTIF